MAVLKRYVQFFVMSWLPAYDGRAGRFSLQRLLVMTLFWPLFLLVQAINGLGLLLDYLLFPDFRRVQVREPLFVVGVPRSGTTFLHRLLAMDERFTTTALWELLFATSITQRYFWTGVARLDKRRKHGLEVIKQIRGVRLGDTWAGAAGRNLRPLGDAQRGWPDHADLEY